MRLISGQSLRAEDFVSILLFFQEHGPQFCAVLDTSEQSLFSAVQELSIGSMQELRVSQIIKVQVIFQPP